MRLTSSSPEIQNLIKSCCGDGSAYNDMPMLTSRHDFREWQYALINAAIQDNTYQVLAGNERQPTCVDEPSDQEYNDFMKQLVIFQRRNIVLIGAMRSHLGRGMRYYLSHNLISPESSAAEFLEIMQSGLGSKRVQKALGYTRDLMSSPTPADHPGDVEKFANVLEEKFMECNDYRIYAEMTPLPPQKLNELFLDRLVRYSSDDWTIWVKELIRKYGTALGKDYIEGPLWDFDKLACEVCEEDRHRELVRWMERSEFDDEAWPKDPRPATLQELRPANSQDLLVAQQAVRCKSKRKHSAVEDRMGNENQVTSDERAKQARLE